MPSKVDTTLSRPIADRIGQTVGERYRIRGLIAKGAASAVYEAEDVATGTLHAIKAVLPGVDAPELLARFRLEARAMAQLAHANIVAAVDLVAEAGELYLVMERLHGATLAGVLEQGAVLPRRALVLARQILEALAHAHAHGMIHRDIKPDNVFVEQLGEPGNTYERVKLLDFGLVKLLGPGDNRLTATGVVFGTPAYMSPEQALGRATDARTDLYAVGVVLFELLAGRKPYASPDPATLVRMQVAAPVPSLGGRGGTAAVEAFVARALAKDPGDRFADAAAMIRALDAAFSTLDHLPATG